MIYYIKLYELIVSINLIDFTGELDYNIVINEMIKLTYHGI